MTVRRHGELGGYRVSPDAALYEETMPGNDGSPWKPVSTQAADPVPNLGKSLLFEPGMHGGIHHEGFAGSLARRGR